MCQTANGVFRDEFKASPRPSLLSNGTRCHGTQVTVISLAHIRRVRPSWIPFYTHKSSNSQNFMEPECSLPLWQQHVTGPYTEPYLTHLQSLPLWQQHVTGPYTEPYLTHLQTYFLKINFNIMDHSAPWSSKCSIYIFFSQTKFCLNLSSPLYVQQALPTSSFWTKRSLYTFTDHMKMQS
jgi:hypothetical protein